MRRSIVGTILIVTLFCSDTVHVAAAQSDLQIEQQREEDLKALGTNSIPSPQRVKATAKALFARPLAEQSEAELKQLAKQANTYANLVRFISDEYSQYYRENYQYKFVQEKVAPARNAYDKRVNEFLDYRNRAYFNLGLKAKAAGNPTLALFYFRDAFRLSAFDCFGTKKEECMRWQAEQELQKLLDLEAVQAYVTWK